MKYHGYCLLLMLVLLYLVWHKKYKETCIVLVGGGIVMFLLQQNVYEPYDNCGNDESVRECGYRVNCVVGDTAPCHIYKTFSTFEPESLFKNIINPHFKKQLYVREQLANSKTLIVPEKATPIAGGGTSIIDRQLVRGVNGESELFRNIRVIMDDLTQDQIDLVVGSPGNIFDTSSLDDLNYRLSSIGPFSLEDIIISWNENHASTALSASYDDVSGTLERAFFEAYDNLVRNFEDNCEFISERGKCDTERLCGITSYYNINKLHRSIADLSTVATGEILVPTVDDVVLLNDTAINDESTLNFKLQTNNTSVFDKFTMLSGCPSSKYDPLIFETLSSKIQEKIGTTASTTATTYMEQTDEALIQKLEELHNPTSTPPWKRGDGSVASLSDEEGKQLKILYGLQVLYNFCLATRKNEDNDLLLGYLVLLPSSYVQVEISDTPCMGTKLDNGQNCSTVVPQLNSELDTIDFSTITSENCGERYREEPIPLNADEGSVASTHQCMWNDTQNLCSDSLNIDGHRMVDTLCEEDELQRKIIEDSSRPWWSRQLIDDIKDEVISPPRWMNPPQTLTPEEVQNELINQNETYLDEQLDALTSLKYLTDNPEWNDVNQWVTGSSGNTLPEVVKKYFGVDDNISELKDKAKRILKEEAVLIEEVELLKIIKVLIEYAEATSSFISVTDMRQKLITNITQYASEETNTINDAEAVDLQSAAQDMEVLNNQLDRASGRMRGTKISRYYQTIGVVTRAPLQIVTTPMTVYKESIHTMVSTSKIGRFYGTLSRLLKLSLIGKSGSRMMGFLGFTVLGDFLLAYDLVDLALGDLNPLHAYEIAQGYMTQRYVREFNDLYTNLGSHPVLVKMIDPRLSAQGVDAVHDIILDRKKGTYNNKQDMEDALMNLTWYDHEFQYIKLIWSQAQLKTGLDMVRNGTCLQMKPDLCYRRNIRITNTDLAQCNELQTISSTTVPVVNLDELSDNLTLPIGKLGPDIVRLSDNAGGLKVNAPHELHYWWVEPPTHATALYDAATGVIDWINTTDDLDGIMQWANTGCIDAATVVNSAAWRNIKSPTLLLWAQQCPTAKIYVDEQARAGGPSIKTNLEKKLDELRPDELYYARGEATDGDSQGPILHTFRGTGLCLPGSECYNARELLSRWDDPGNTGMLYGVQNACSTMICGKYEDNNICNDHCNTRSSTSTRCCQGTERGIMYRLGEDRDLAWEENDRVMYNQAEKVGYCASDAFAATTSEDNQACNVEVIRKNTDLVNLHNRQIIDPYNYKPRYTSEELERYDPDYELRPNKALLIGSHDNCMDQSTSTNAATAELVDVIRGDLQEAGIGGAVCCRPDQYVKTDGLSGDVMCADCLGPSHYMNPEGTSCIANECTCENGVPSVADNCSHTSSFDLSCCPVDGLERCSSCNPDYYLVSNLRAAQTSTCTPKLESGHASGCNSVDCYKCSSGKARYCNQKITGVSSFFSTMADVTEGALGGVCSDASSRGEWMCE